MVTQKNSVIKDSFSTFVLQKRIEAKISQETLSRRIGVKRSTISMIEAKRNGVNLDSAILILTGLGLGLADYETYLKGVISESVDK